ncbi:MAG: hypothetical protein HOP11_03455 [Saprospiraceae bacterium]|nr:hypothetical protein [Saprospiraceae bacterium]
MSILTWIKSLFFGKPEQQIKPVEKPLDFSMPDFSKSTSSNSSGSVADKTTTEKIDDLAEKAVDFAKGTAEEVKTQGKAMWEAVKDKIEDLDEGTKEFRENIKNKANEALEKIDKTVDEVLEKGKQIDEKEAELDSDKDGIADKRIDFGKTIEEKHGGFFEKAEKWLDKNEKITPHTEVNDDAGNETPKDKPTLELPKE